MPSGSKFSMLQTVMQVSLLSRMTSYSISFQPRRYCSINTCPMGLAERPDSAMRANSARVRATPPPVPPSVNAGRTTTGRPISPAKLSASSSVVTVLLGGTAMPRSSSNCLKSSVLRLVNGGERRAQQFNVELIQHARLGERDRQIEASLPAERRQQTIRALAFDDAAHHLYSQRLDIGDVSDAVIGHDRCGIRVDQDDALALFAQRLARLRPSVVELRRLPDDDRSGADHQH